MTQHGERFTKDLPRKEKKNIPFIWIRFTCKPYELFGCEVLVYASHTLSYELLFHRTEIVSQKNIQTIKDLKKTA